MRGLLKFFLGNVYVVPHVEIGKLLSYAFFQRLLRINSNVLWPVHRTSSFKEPSKIERVDTCPGFAPGCYIDARNGVVFGGNVRVGPGVKIISMNHSLVRFDEYIEEGSIEISRDCWLGANCVILPGVRLGRHTIVASGAVVTKSFEEEDVVLAGVPARVIRKIPPYEG